jgi:hypothetical protein
MSRNRFVVPEVVRINLSDEEWIEIKKELNAGEERRHFNLATIPFVVNGQVVERVDWSQYEILRVHLWLVKWHIHDEKGEVPLLSLDAIRALDVPTFEEINQHIVAHILQQKELKKAQANPKVPSASPTLQ